MTNLLSLNDAVRNGNRVFMDTDVDNCFFVIDQDRCVTKFPCNERGLYIMERPASIKSRAMSHAGTTIEGYTAREVMRAKKARKLYHDLNAPSIPDLKVWIRANMGKNNEVTCDDINLAEKMFKADVPTYKGRGIKPRPPVVFATDIIELPPELKVRGRKVELSVDVLFINNKVLLHSKDRTIKFKGLSTLGTFSKKQGYNSERLFQALDMILRFYNKASVEITRIHEGNKFKNLFEELVDKWDVDLNFSNPGKHVPDIEWENRVLQKRFWVVYYCLPFKVIPKIMIKRITMRITRHRNYFPDATGISCYYSTGTIMSGKQLDCKKKLVHSFGDYVQANNEIKFKNNNLPRTLDCIYLQAVNSLQGGHELMDLATGRLIVRPKVMACLMTRVVIDRVDELARKEGFKSLKFFNRKWEEVLENSDLLAGGGA